MEVFKKQTHIDFLGKRKPALVFSGVLMFIAIVALVLRGLNWGIDFTGGTLVEIGYQEPVAIDGVRATLQQGGFNDAVVQHFGTARDVLVRLPASESEKASEISDRVMATLRQPYGELLAESLPGGLQKCTSGSSKVVDCRVQMRRVEFVGPQVGDELANQGGMAMLYALIGILIYVTLRFEWRFAVGSVAALVHDVLVTVGAFALLQFEFTLPVLAAVLAVIGYSLNDTIVVFDRIRENFRKMRRGSSLEIMNSSINQTLPRTILTSVTTLLVVVTLLLLGGEVIYGFAIALTIGILIGTYSSIFVASPVVLGLGISREDLTPVKKEGVGQDAKF